MNEDEERLHNSLAKINSRLPNVFYSIFVVLRQQPPKQTKISKDPNTKPTPKLQMTGTPNPGNNIEENPDRVSQSAHSARETLNLILRDLKLKADSDTSTKNCSNEKSKQKNNIQKLVDLYAYAPNTNPSFRNELTDRILDLYGLFVSISHHRDNPISEQEYSIKLETYVKLLNYVFDNHYKVKQEMEQILEIQNPNKNDLEKLKPLLSKNRQLYRDFFDNAKSNWLELLISEKYFEKIPNLNEDNPDWPEYYYLERIAVEKPEQIKNIILKINITKSELVTVHQVLCNLIRAAIKMPPNIAKEVAKKAIKKWYKESTSQFLVHDLTNLMHHLIDQEFQTALDIYFVLIDVKPDPDKSDADNSDFLNNMGQRLVPMININVYEDILKKYTPLLCDVDYDSVLEKLIEKLVKANSLANKIYLFPKESHYDESNAWRAAIEEHERNYKLDPRSHLVTAIRQTLEKSEYVGIASLKKSLEILKCRKRDYHIFSRLEMYFFGRHPLDFSDEVDRLISEYFDNNNFKHEYYYLLHNNYPHLKYETQKSIKEMISRGPDPSKYKRSDEKFTEYKEIWKIEKLYPIIDYLPELKKEFDSLVQKHGKPSNIDFSRYPTRVYREQPPPSELNESMSVLEVIEFIHSYKIPDEISFLEDSTGRKFRELVKKNSKEYSQHAMKLQSCHGLFQFRFLEGLSNSRNVDWHTVFDLCELIIVDSPSKDHSILHWVLIYFGDILKNNLHSDKSTIQFNLRNKIWNILEKAIEIAPDDKIESDRYSAGDQDAMFIADNTSIGILIWALMEYAIWCSKEIKNKENPHILVPEVKKLLELKLDPKNDQSVSFHTMLGYYFPNLLLLDKDWTKSNISLIFNHSPLHINVGNAAWDGYTLRAIYEASYDVLFDEYKYRISNIIDKDMLTVKDTSRSLTQQIALICLNDLNRHKELFILFLTKSNPVLVKEYLEYVGHIIEVWDDTKPPKIDIFELLSHNEIKSNPNMGWLFLTSVVPNSEYLTLLKSVLIETKGEIYPLYRLVKKINSFVEYYPIEVLECIEKIIKYDQIHDMMFMILNDLDDMFSKITVRKNKQAIDKMNQIINILGSLGYDQFRKFYG